MINPSKRLMSPALLPPVLPIAQVHTPHGAVWYISYARRHDDFVVQRRYRGIGAPSYRQWPEFHPTRVWKYYRYVESYEEPFLNPGAIQAAGLSEKRIRKWNAAHPGAIFTHPTYAALCLRWGDNAHGYQVSELPEQVIEPGAVFLTPHTCWQSGTTYYHWGRATTADAELLEQVKMAGGLRDHVRELGWEGSWQGWYTTDRRALERVLAPLGRRVVLAQPCIRYANWVVAPQGQEEVLLQADQAEAAQASYAALPEKRGVYEGPQVAFGHLVQWPGQPIEWSMVAEKFVAMPPEGDFFLQHGVQGAPLSVRLDVNQLADLEECTSTVLPTLAEVLATTGLSQRTLAAELDWPVDEFQERAIHPERLTLAEIEQIAKISGRMVARLVAELREEVHARRVRLVRSAIEAL